MITEIVLRLILLTGPDNQPIQLNIDEVVSVRQPRSADHFAVGARCIINTTDGKFVLVQELCSSVLRFVEIRQHETEKALDRDDK
jgi:hypothetical protein